MLTYLKSWYHCCRGATGLEYALLAGGIALAVIAVTVTLGGDLNSVFEDMDSSLEAAMENRTVEEE